MTVFFGADMTVSVAMCTFNGALFIEEQLKSIFHQKLQPFEIVIVDDCSSDNTIEIIKKLSDAWSGKITIIENEATLGVVKNFQKAISHCSGDFIALCDQDDIWLEEKLLKQHKRIMKEEESFGKQTPILIYNDLDLINSAGKSLGKTYFESSRIVPPKKNEISTYSVVNLAAGCSLIFNQSLKKLALPFDDRVVMHDWWLAILASAAGNIIFMDEVLVKYRQHKNNVVGSTDDLISLFKKAKSPFRLFRKQKFNYLQATSQFLAVGERLRLHQCDISDVVVQYEKALAGRRVDVLKLMLRGVINRQGILRSLSYLSGLLQVKN